MKFDLIDMEFRLDLLKKYINKSLFYMQSVENSINLLSKEQIVNGFRSYLEFEDVERTVIYRLLDESPEYYYVFELINDYIKKCNKHINSIGLSAINEEDYLHIKRIDKIVKSLSIDKIISINDFKNIPQEVENIISLIKQINLTKENN